MTDDLITILNLLVSNIKLNKLHIEIFEEMAKENNLSDKQRESLEESKRIYITQVQQLQSIIDRNSRSDN